MHSKQKFKFEIPYCIKLISEIKNGNTTIEQLKDATGAGENRVVTFLEWLKYIGAVTSSNKEIKLTKLGKSYLDIQYSDDFLEPLILYHLLRNPDLQENDGHFYFAKLVNDYLYRLVFDYDNTTTFEKAKKEMYKLGAEEKYPEFITGALTVLSDSETGFGKLGIVEENEENKKNGNYEIHSYWVEPLVAAYIIYDMWEENQTTMGIEKIINDRYNLGRMFLMDEDAVRETLEEMKALKLIAIEVAGGLNQIRINPGITKENILDMIVREA